MRAGPLLPRSVRSGLRRAPAEGLPRRLAAPALAGAGGFRPNRPAAQAGAPALSDCAQNLTDAEGLAGRSPVPDTGRRCRVHGADSAGYNWQWGRVLPYIFTLEDSRFTAGPLLLGLVETLPDLRLESRCWPSQSASLTAILRMSDSFAGRGLARGYIGLIRNTPLLVQLNLFYFIVSPIFDISRLWTGILCLAVFEGAYASEIFRSGILAVRKGQGVGGPAPDSVSRPIKTYRFVVLPQALRIMLPPLTGVGVT